MSHGGWGSWGVGFQAILVKEHLLCQEDANGIGQVGGGGGRFCGEGGGGPILTVGSTVFEMWVGSL